MIIKRDYGETRAKSQTLIVFHTLFLFKNRIITIPSIVMSAWKERKRKRKGHAEKSALLS